MINLHERMLPTSAGVEPVNSWTSVGRRIQLSHRGPHSLLVGDTKSECQTNVSETVSVLTNVGVLINKEKSVLMPTKDIGFLGNRINSEKMIVYLPSEKVQKIIAECINLSSKKSSSIREVSCIIGLIVSSFSAVQYCTLFYRELDRETSSPRATLTHMNTYTYIHILNYNSS